MELDGFEEIPDKFEFIWIAGVVLFLTSAVSFFYWNSELPYAAYALGAAVLLLFASFFISRIYYSVKRKCPYCGRIMKRAIVHEFDRSCRVCKKCSVFSYLYSRNAFLENFAELFKR